jgi:Serine hydrolase (FSH1)
LVKVGSLIDFVRRVVVGTKQQCTRGGKRTTGRGHIVGVSEGLDFVVQHIHQQPHPYEALLGFSQGGVVATAVACSGRVPGSQAVVTAGSPLIEEAFRVLQEIHATEALDSFSVGWSRSTVSLEVLLSTSTKQHLHLRAQQLLHRQRRRRPPPLDMELSARKYIIIIALVRSSALVRNCAANYLVSPSSQKYDI